MTPLSVASLRRGSGAPSAGMPSANDARAADVAVDEAFAAYFRCPDDLARIAIRGPLSQEQGFFTYGGELAYGRCAGVRPVPSAGTDVPEAWPVGRTNVDRPTLPFRLSDSVRDLREERYRENDTADDRLQSLAGFRNAYYAVRPLLPVELRRHIQRMCFAGWEQIPFPRWPVDVTVESLMERSMREVLKCARQRAVPFIWFWPDGAPSAVMMTHDVEGPSGERFCPALMNIDDEFGIRAAFQIVPSTGGDQAARVSAFRQRGFEVNLHDWKHDGSLFRSWSQFARGAERINSCAREFGCKGFRSGSMYRNQRWLGALGISYDMSVPNVAHLEPQRGGCCTVMPYFVGNVLELPLTTTQDYSLFHILGDYSIALWKTQIDLIRQRHGLISFITHPDYLADRRAQAVYREVLAHLSALREAHGAWVALPGEIDAWWRNRHRMRLVRDGRSWRIEGPGSTRARLAYAALEGDRVVYSLAATD